MAQDTAQSPRAAEFVTDDQLLHEWLKSADNVTLACWDEGHFWDMGAKDTTFVSTETGIWGAKEKCHRRVDGVSCKVKRTRFQNPSTGYLDGRSVYDYRAYKLVYDHGVARFAYSLPRSESGYSILNKHTRAAIRMERKNRKGFGEDVGGKLAEETK